MVMPARLLSDHWNSTHRNQDIGELMTSPSDDKLKEICSDSDRSHADPFDEGPDASEEEDAATFTILKDEVNWTDEGRLEEAMPCTQSFQDTEGLEEHLMASDRMYGNSRASAFSGYKAPGAQLRIMASNGCQMGEENFYTDPCMSSTPFWYRGDVPSQCSRGCCAFPRSGLSFSQRGTLLGPEYVEYGEDSFPTRNGLARWNSTGLGTDNRLPNGSISMASSSPAVSDTLVSMLNYKDSGGADNTLSSIIQEIVAREIKQHTATAVQALEQQQQ